MQDSFNETSPAPEASGSGSAYTRNRVQPPRSTQAPFPAAFNQVISGWDAAAVTVIAVVRGSPAGTPLAYQRRCRI